MTSAEKVISNLFLSSHTSEIPALKMDANDQASLPMYDFPPLVNAHDKLWTRITAHLGGPVPVLLHDGRTWDLWTSSRLLFSQSCGYPLISSLKNSVTVLGAFEYDIPSANGPTYCSVIIRKMGANKELPCVAAVNDHMSLSGWLSLLAYLGVKPNLVVETGSHRASIAAVRNGKATIASIDAVTFSLLTAIYPEEMTGIETIGQGPRVPCLPLISSHQLSTSERDAWQAALHAAVPDKSLRIRAFHALQLEDYMHALSPLCEVVRKIESLSS